MKPEDIVGPTLAKVLPQTDKWWFQQPHLLKLNLVLVIPLMSAAASGYDGALIGGLLALPQWHTFFGFPTGALLGFVVASQFIGALLALPLIGYLVDRYGRKPVMFTGIVAICIAAAIQTASVNLAMFIASRFLVGAGSAILAQPAPIIIAELSYPVYRGTYTASMGTMYFIGAIIAAWTTFGTQNYATWSWRIPSLVQCALPLAQLSVFRWLPESPRWLVAKGREAEAVAIFTKYHVGGVENHPLVLVEIAEIKEALELDKIADATGFMQLVSTPGDRRRLFIALCVGVMAQWNGIGIIAYFLPLVLASVGIKDAFSQTLINGLIQIFNFLVALGASFLVDRIGRRAMFIWSGLGMLCAYIALTVSSALNFETGTKATGIAAVVSIFIFHFHYDIAYTPLLMGYPTEIFTFRTRSKGIAVELMSIYAALTLAAFVNPIGIENIGWKYYIVFCCLLVVFFAISYFFFPETRGRSLEEIAEIFDGTSVGALVEQRAELGQAWTSGKELKEPVVAVKTNSSEGS